MALPLHQKKKKSVSMRKKHWCRIRKLCFSPISATKYVTYGKIYNQFVSHEKK